MSSKDYRISDKKKVAALTGLLFSLAVLTLAVAFENDLRDSEGIGGGIIYTLLTTVSLAVISGILVLYAVELVFQRTNMEAYKAHIGEIIEQKLQETGLAPHGVREIHSRMPRDRIGSMISGLSPSEELLILQTYSDGLVGLSPDLQKFFQNGGKARALFLDPRSEVVNLRANQLPSKSRQDYALNICENIRKVQQMSNGNVEIKIYNEIPWFGMYGNRETIFLMMYSSSDYGVNNPNIEVFPGQYLNFLLDNFEQIWKKYAIFNIVELDKIEKQIKNS